MKKQITVLIVTFSMLFMLASCSVDLHKWFPNIVKEETTTSKDFTTYISYTDIESLKEDLDSGKDVTGCIVSFTVQGVSYAENEGDFNVYKAGSHINFISDRKIATEKGRTMVVEITQADNINGEYWAINFTVPE